MKPQSLQDAIKAQALRKEKARQTGGWKEPYVKKYEITAEDLAKSPKRVQSPMPVPPLYASAPPAVNNQELVSLKTIVEGMQQELKQQRVDITTLQKENEELRRTLRSRPSIGDSAQGSSSSRCMQSPPSSPTSLKKAKPPALLEPHSVEDLAKYQRLDEALRYFMKTKQGLYDSKYLSIREEKGGNLVCFKNKIFIPHKLREKTIRHYKSEHPTDSIALAALRKNCCWPDLEKDFFGQGQ